MNNKIKYLSVAMSTLLVASSCKKALDINDNPNSPTQSTPELVLPQAMVATALSVPTYNTYGGRLVGYYATSGGVSGWGDMITYDFSTGFMTGLWSTPYNTLTDLQYVVEKAGEGKALFVQAAEVMKVYNYANLVDTYNDVPYSDALKGAASLTPKYDKAADIYVDLAKKLDAAVAFFKSATASDDFKTADVIFKGNTTSWAKFANTLKLRLVLRAGSKATFANKTIDNIGVIESDVIVQPVFTKISGKQNPMWNTWAYGADNAAVGTWGTQFIPTNYIMAFYDGFKISDSERASLVFANGISTNKNQLGNVDNPPTGVAPSAWVMRPVSGTISGTNYRGLGVIKGPAAGQPLMLAAESQFLAAEAALDGLISGGDEASRTYFRKGIMASYNYLYMNEGDAPTKSAADAQAYLTKYETDNNDTYLVKFVDYLDQSNPNKPERKETGKEQKREAIITQKYIALNFLFGHEAWNEFRRSGYPKNVGLNTTANARTTFVSIASRATSEDKLPTRILYPNTEFSYNAANVPADINKYSSKIFWAK
ncbi:MULTISPECIES: SusD/RagB family nutrient-binding outer membrane lipoprotein [Sphingobacterium]|uniref:SusD-like starch-binding protein associating with outer membrane n=1 Tax=Sphingobacterium siyangense TaxID=459529 RepID=A0A562M814_9SPHI|nr:MULTISPECIES: SusD/RagB family nutrient-binding outer membrane lipoprotein [Sphingobacterium]TWI15962.1 SusD-like starch-binding protein associating with outer membrane [Sphingobacterium siyangense]HBI87402.1 SusD/RagB family nutrient-binding outer membrane lipoprotein [Sphingobacterium sp.]